MLIQLAPEYWMEIFDFLVQHRRVVAEKISQFGDRQFSDLCQHWLHERTRNVQLNNIIIQSTGVKSSLKWTLESNWTNVPIAQVPMPENIVGFKRIVIKDLNSEVLNFLNRMPTLFTNIRLEFCSDKEEADAENAMIAFERLLPLFNGITEIALVGTSSFFELIQKKFPSAVLEKASFIHFDVEEGLLPDDCVQFIANFLFAKWQGDGPRRCAVIGEGNGVAALAMSLDQLNQLLAIIRENFLAATTSTSFIFNFYPSSPDPINNVQQFHIENDNTGEQLIVLKEEEGKMLFIIRCPSVDVNAWTRQHKIEHQLENVITIFRPEIGELGEEDPKEEKEEYEEGYDDQPGPSKKMKLT